MPSFNVAGKNTIEADLKLFFGFDETPSWNGVVLLTDDDKSVAHLMARLGIFSSIGDAKRNGWNVPIPSGWNHFKVGKNKEIFLWNPTE